LLYHGSNVLVKNPRIIVSAKKLDFGAGFYLTSSYEQAKRWARLKTSRLKKGKAVVSVFEIADDRLFTLKTITYPRADKAWLEMITLNRTNAVYDAGYDVIIGPVADDDTLETIRLYFRGMYDEEEALKRLLPQRLKDQYAFKTEASLMILRFEKGDDV